MIIHKMTASFGRLQGETLTLHEGLNIIYAPNEGGKSTWSHFIRAMLYGVNTAERSRNGSLPDKTRFRPWGSLPMQGSMDITWHGQRLTLTRTAAGGDKPMGSCVVTYTDTGERVHELMGKNTGELLLGVGEPVYRRSAFITSQEIPVDREAELEKKITALVTSGEEDCSYTDADERLRRWQRKRRFRTDSGRLPEAEKRLSEVRQALTKIEAENTSLASMRENITKLEKQKELLELELKRHGRDERLEAKKRLAAAELEYANLKTRLQILKKEIGDATAADIKELEAEISRLEIYNKSYNEAAAALDRAVLLKSKLPQTLPKSLAAKGVIALICFVLALMCCIAAPITDLWLFAIPAAALIAAGVFLVLLRSKDMAKERSERDKAYELAQYKVEASKKQCETLTNELSVSEKKLALLMERLGARDTESPHDAVCRISEAITTLTQTAAEAEAASVKVDLLRDMSGEDIEKVDGETKITKAEAEYYLTKTASEYERLTRELARGEGVYSRLGDPLLLATEEKRLTEEIEALEKEYKALDHAIYALRDANNKLQSLFSPVISREAGRLMSQMTSGNYKGVYFDRELRFSAARTEDITAHELEYLSDGTKNQLYLAVRLALCRLVLKPTIEGDMCHIILDDVLDSFDDERAKLALRLLSDIAVNEKRQIILFTCHSRELLSSYELQATRDGGSC